MTPAAELWAAVKEHATADVDFRFLGGECPALYILSRVQANIGRCVNGSWFVDIVGVSVGDERHPSASSAVYSAFLRARGKQP